MNLNFNRLSDRLRQPRVFVPLAIAGSLLLGIGLGRHSSGPPSTAPRAASESLELGTGLALNPQQVHPEVAA